MNSFTDGGWTEEAAKAVVELTHDRMLQAQITGYTETGIPEIYLYAYLDPNVSACVRRARIACEQNNNSFRFHLQNIVFINKELVARNFAELLTEA